MPVHLLHLLLHILSTSLLSFHCYHMIILKQRYSLLLSSKFACSFFYLVNCFLYFNSLINAVLFSSSIERIEPLTNSGLAYQAEPSTQKESKKCQLVVLSPVRCIFLQSHRGVLAALKSCYIQFCLKRVLKTFLRNGWAELKWTLKLNGKCGNSWRLGHLPVGNSHKNELLHRVPPTGTLIH